MDNMTNPGWETEGQKFDTGKDPWDLVPGDAVQEIVKVLNFGANKYAPRNWEKGMRWGRPFAALMRHMWAWWGGEDKDPETGLSHLAHAGCCIFFLLAFEKRGIGNDDRYKLNEDTKCQSQSPGVIQHSEPSRPAPSASTKLELPSPSVNRRQMLLFGATGYTRR